MNGTTIYMAVKELIRFTFEVQMPLTHFQYPKKEI